MLYSRVSGTALKCTRINTLRTDTQLLTNGGASLSYTGDPASIIVCISSTYGVRGGVELSRRHSVERTLLRNPAPLHVIDCRVGTAA